MSAHAELEVVPVAKKSAAAEDSIDHFRVATSIVPCQRSVGSASPACDELPRVCERLAVQKPPARWRVVVVEHEIDSCGSEGGEGALDQLGYADLDRVESDQAPLSLLRRRVGTVDRHEHPKSRADILLTQGS